MSFIKRETVITLPAELVRSNKSGFGMDAGCSAVKLVYITKEDKDQAYADNSATVNIRALVIQRQELAEGLEFLKQRAYIFGEDIQSDEKSPEINLTGFGCRQEETTIAKIINLRYKILSEFELIPSAFCYLAAKLPRRLLIEPHDDEQSVNDAVRYNVVSAGVIALHSKNAENQQCVGHDQPQFIDTLLQNAGYAIEAENPTDNRSLLEAEPELYPFQLVAFGSYTFAVKVTEPGVLLLGEGTPFGGKSLIGMANKFVGCKSYEELVDLASKGDSRRVHEMSTDLFESMKSIDEENTYKAMQDVIESKGIEAFMFGKLVGANCDDFRREDLASSLLDHFARDLVQHVQISCRLQGVYRVFLHGGLLSHPIVRRRFVKEMIRSNMAYFLSARARPIVFDIIRFSQYLAVIGCLIPDQEP